MTKVKALNKLKREARAAAAWRGHNMMNFETTKSGERAVSHCVDCNMEVAVIRNPMPNEISIGGEAVALQCLPKRESDILPEYKIFGPFGWEVTSCGG